MQDVKEPISIKHKFSQEQLDNLNKRFEDAYPDEILAWGFQTFGADMVLGTGFGPSGVFLI
ncbi:MAG: hypothetical protein GWN61_21700, partial [candidate division Zixibacteria bacterium]|nr:hypothetical protein [Gammaproteobacteria bacterium]NIR63045.1 hypothetical protein [candidate division Zixibacteria bacterium]NIV08720.1 hypothetical protein [candidate division Zixibacteria bacterium]NIX55059.1 hypothetical protein [candidate division Zixibacteria bacterium]